MNDGHDDCSDGSDEDGGLAIANISRIVGGGFLFLSFILVMVGLAVNGRRGSKKHHHVVQQVVQPVQRMVSGSAETNVSGLVENARNLERARDFDAAAQMYQQAGMFEEAGRVRQAHLEKEGGAVVQIGHVGDNVVNQSVMVKDGGSGNSKTCPTCQKIIAEGWSFCPNCDANK
ncbi:MAG: hypothetical protein VX473_05985 [Candidatus Thermoplasmatota archaeon]|nr:hypothetical protein [Candidatus Thermoplasmatota archaeon]